MSLSAKHTHILKSRSHYLAKMPEAAAPVARVCDLAKMPEAAAPVARACFDKYRKKRIIENYP